MLHRYWIELESSDPKLAYEGKFHYGVTAYNYEDALKLLVEKFFMNRDFPSAVSVVEDVHISTLKAGKLVTEIGVPVWRGIGILILVINADFPSLIKHLLFLHATPLTN